MVRKLAILQMSDTPQIESTAVMLRHAGYRVSVCGPNLRNELMRIGCDTVLSVDHMRQLGYDRLDPSIPEANINDVDRCDLFVEIKVRNVPKIIDRWPNLQGRIAYWRVNGAQPEICPKGGDEVNLPCPVITACLWYGTERYKHGKSDQGQVIGEHEASRPVDEKDFKKLCREARPGDNDMAYTFWPPFPRSRDYTGTDRSKLTSYKPAYCMCHSARAWGYQPIVDQCVKLGVKIYGNNSPAGQVSHWQVAGIAAEALALVHLKSVDCPGWALYEALLSGCPVITGRLLNSRMLAYDLLEDGVTCLEFGVPATLEYGRGDMNFDKCMDDIIVALTALKDKKLNFRIGEAGRQRLLQLMWNEERDGDGFIHFMRRHYG